MSDGMTEVFRHKKIVRKKINKYVTLFLDNNDDIVIIENTIGGPQLTNRIYLKVKTFNKIIKALKGMTNGF